MIRFFNFTLTDIINLFADGLSWYFYDAGQVIATKIAKKPSDGIDRGDSLGFQEYIQSWYGARVGGSKTLKR